MIPLLPVGGIIDHRFGILTAPNHKGVPSGIVAGMRWAADLGCEDGPPYVKRCDAGELFPWLDSMLPWRPACLFVGCPDVVGDARHTIDAYWRWFQHFTGWPLAFVAQDGQEDLEFPGDEWQCLFVGGSTTWKTSEAAYSVILRAQALGKRIHIGRVNWWKRYQHFAGMPGAERWTCDGTRTRFDGTKRTVEAWADYMVRPVQIRFAVSVRHCGS